MSSWMVGIDTGGTFTDVVVADGAGQFTIGKALTTPERISLGLKAALQSAAETLNLDLPGLLARAELFIYGTTRATNAIVTGATFFGADLRGANLAGARGLTADQLIGARIDIATILPVGVQAE